MFAFDAVEFKSIVTYKSVELNNGATLTAESSDFDKVWEQERVRGSDNELKFSTTGQIVNEKLKAST